MLLTDLWTISISLKTILCETGSQCSSFKIGVIWHDFLDELLCCVCAEDEIFDSAGDHNKSIPVIEPWCDKCMYNLFSSTLIQVFPYSANISDMKWWYANNVGHNGFRVIVESNITPKFRAYDEGVICESPIVINGRETFDNCWRDPNRKNLSSFNFKTFCLIQLRISWIHFSSVVIHESACSWEDLKVM